MFEKNFSKLMLLAAALMFVAPVAGVVVLIGSVAGLIAEEV